MNEQKFLDSMSKLEEVYKKLPPSAMRIWWQAFSERGYTDEDFEKGVEGAFFLSNYFPTVKEVDTVCASAKRERIEREHGARKAEEARYRRTTSADIIGPGVEHKNPFVRDVVGVTMDLLRGKITISEWRPRHAEIMERR